MTTLATWGCVSCGYEGPRLYRVCPDCGSPGSLGSLAAPLVAKTDAAISHVRPLAEIATEATIRRTGLGLWDDALGGWSPGCVYVAGAPGAGKTTLALKLAGTLDAPVLLATAEESPTQLAAAADKLSVASSSLFILPEQSTAEILRVAARMRPGALILNSVNTVLSPSARGGPGSATQMRAVTRQVHEWALSARAMAILIGRITWKGHSEGPRAVEHEVEAVVYLRILDGGQRWFEVRKARPPFVGTIRGFPVPEWA